MKKKFKAVFSSIALVTGFMAMQMIVPMIIGIYYGVNSSMAGQELDPAIISRVAESQPAIIMMQIIGVLFLLAIFKRKKTKVKEYIAIKKVQSNKILMYLAYGVAFQLVTIMANMIILQFYDIRKSAEVITNMIQSGNVFLSILIVIILAPLVEEFLFRGIILTKLNNHLSQKGAIVIQAVLFSLIHFNLAQMIPTFLLGLFLGVCYLKFENLCAPILIHFSFNVFASLVLYIPENLYFIIYFIPIIAALISVDLSQKHLAFSE